MVAGLMAGCGWRRAVSGGENHSPNEPLPYRHRSEETHRESAHTSDASLRVMCRALEVWGKEARETAAAWAPEPSSCCVDACKAHCHPSCSPSAST